MQPIYLLIGSPGSGKTWVSDQLKDKFKVLSHDRFAYGGSQSRSTYADLALKEAKSSSKPILIETPSSIKQIYDPLIKAGARVEPVFILEHENVVRSRYFQRENKPIPTQHITRLNTYRQRAQEMKAYSGTSVDVLNYLKRRFS